jgi:hypothetical protein
MVGKRGFNVSDAKHGNVPDAKHDSILSAKYDNFTGFNHEGMHGRSTSFSIFFFFSPSPISLTIPLFFIDLNSGTTTPDYPY